MSSLSGDTPIMFVVEAATSGALVEGEVVGTVDMVGSCTTASVRGDMLLMSVIQLSTLLSDVEVATLGSLVEGEIVGTIQTFCLWRAASVRSEMLLMLLVELSTS